METRSQSVVVDGMRLHWAECGAADDPVPVVLLHGLNDSHRTWSTIAPLLAAKRRVLMPDAPGCGLSERPDASYSLEWHTHVIARWLENLGVSRVDLVGHSFGGGVAQMLLLEPKLRVRRIALIASGGLGSSIGIWLRLAALPGVIEYFGQPFMAAGTRLALRAAGSAIPDRYVDELSAMNASSGTARAFARTVQGVITWRGQSKHFFHRAHEIKRLPPMALFWGDADPITPVKDALAFSNAVEGVRCERFAGCGHYLHHEKAEELAGKLGDFLNAKRARPMRLRKIRSSDTPAWERKWAAFLDMLIPAKTAPQH